MSRKTQSWLLTKSTIDNVLRGLFGHSLLDPIKITTNDYAVTYDRKDIEETSSALDLEPEQPDQILPFPLIEKYPTALATYSRALAVYNRNIKMLAATYRSHGATEPPYSLECSHVQTNAHKHWEQKRNTIIDKLYAVEVAFFDFDEPPPKGIERPVPSIDVVAATVYWYANLETKFTEKRCLVDCDIIVKDHINTGKLKIKKNLTERLNIYRKIHDDCLSRVQAYVHKALYFLLSPNASTEVDINGLVKLVDARLSGGETSSDEEIYSRLETDQSSSESDPETAAPDDDDGVMPPTK